MSCQIYQTGKDEIFFGDADWLSRYKWIVYDYEELDYEGVGEATALTIDGKLMGFNLGHCSCYGPLDDIENCYGSIVDKKVFLESQHDVHQGERDAHIAKVVELLLAEGE